MRIKGDLIWTVPYDQGISHLLLPGILYRGCLSIWMEKIHNEIFWAANLFYAQNHDFEKDCCLFSRDRSDDSARYSRRYM